MPSRKRTNELRNEVKAKKRKLQKNGDKENAESDTFLPVSDPFIREDEGEVGIIEKVTLKNFMCHSNLEFTFGPHVNFVIGRNGSGKSAVLNGIILALGGKSSITGRNANIKGFIQNGKQSADLSVTLRNCGPDAYRPNDYGPRIIVERRINIEGTSNYKLKGDRGKLVSIKREELNNILDALNIQVDNPVSILTQDASRSFLESKDPKRKYSLFIKATQLEKLQEQYDEAQKKIKESEETLRNKIETLPEAEKEVKKWEEKLKKLESLKDQEKRIEELENELSWAIVKEAEDRENCCRQIKEKYFRALEKTKSTKQELEKRLSKCLDGIRTTQHKQTEKQKEILTHKGEVDTLAQAGNNICSELRDQQLYLTKLQRQLQSLITEISHIEKAIEELKRKSQEDSEEVQRRRQKQIEELNATNAECQLKLDDTEAKLAECSNNITEWEREAQIKNEEIVAYRYKIGNKKRELSTMEASRSNQAFLYGPEMPALLERIKSKSNLFQRPPLGPVGIYLKVRDSKWSFAVECCLRAILKSFCCDNMKDKCVLQEIMHEVYGAKRIPNIIVSKFLPQVHDVRTGRVICNCYPAVLDIISCNEPAILNCLIDQQSIEKVLLIEQSSEAANFMMYSPPKNCFCSYTLIGDQVFPDPKYRYYSCRKAPNIHYLQQCFTLEDIRMKQSEISSLEEKVGELQNELVSLSSYIKENKSLDKMYGQKKLEIQAEMFSILENLKDLNETEEFSDGLTTKQSDLEGQLAWREKLKVQIAETKKEFKKKEEDLKKIKLQREVEDDKLKEKLSAVEKLLDHLETYQSEQVDLEAKIDQCSTSLTSDEAKFKDAEQEWKEADDFAEERVQEALLVCPRIIVTKTPGYIKNEITELTNAVAEETSKLNREDVRKKYVEKREKFESIKLEIARLERMNQRMKKMIKQRLDKFRSIRSEMTLGVQYTFQGNMKTRNYTGILSFDHENATLNIEANPQQTNTSDLYKTSSLSGGERSYVTVSLLLALYNATEIPFHILDEYDVFMDSLNKDMSMKIMMEVASTLKKSQFIFLSPLDLPSTINESLIQIHRMPDPERSA